MIIFFFSKNSSSSCDLISHYYPRGWETPQPATPFFFARYALSPATSRLLIGEELNAKRATAIYVLLSAVPDVIFV